MCFWPNKFVDLSQVNLFEIKQLNTFFVWNKIIKNYWILFNPFYHYFMCYLFDDIFHMIKIWPILKIDVLVTKYDRNQSCIKAILLLITLYQRIFISGSTHMKPRFQNCSILKTMSVLLSKRKELKKFILQFLRTLFFCVCFLPNLIIDLLHSVFGMEFFIRPKMLWKKNRKAGVLNQCRINHFNYFLLESSIDFVFNL